MCCNLAANGRSGQRISGTLAGEVDEGFCQWFLAGLCEGAAVDEDVVAVVGVDGVEETVGGGAAGDGEAFAAVEFKKRGSAFLLFG